MGKRKKLKERGEEEEEETKREQTKAAGSEIKEDIETEKFPWTKKLVIPPNILSLLLKKIKR